MIVDAVKLKSVAHSDGENFKLYFIEAYLGKATKIFNQFFARLVCYLYNTPKIGNFNAIFYGLQSVHSHFLYYPILIPSSVIIKVGEQK